jgi:predicted dehydrogenase
MSRSRRAARRQPVRWGILGAARIARKNWKAIRNSGNGLVTAIASRDPRRGRCLITECQRAAPFDCPPRVFDSYADLLASPEVDAVYLPLPTGLRKEWVLRAAAAGKHVLCEKPCARNATDLRAMLEACRRHRVQFMDGVMFVHSRRFERIRNLLDNGRIGRNQRLSAHFSFRATESFLRRDIRMRSQLEPQGCLGDLGWYCVRFMLWAMRWQLPRAVAGRILSQRAGVGSAAPVPTGFAAELRFQGGVSAGFYCSFLAENQQVATISGTKGYLTIPDFVLPFRGNRLEFELFNPAFRQAGCDFEMTPHRRRVSVREHGNSHPTAQESRLFRHFNRQIRSGRLNTEWPDSACKTQLVLDACLASARAGGRAVPLRNRA